MEKAKVLSQRPWPGAERERLDAELNAVHTSKSRQALAKQIIELDVLLFEANLITMPREAKSEGTRVVAGNASAPRPAVVYGQTHAPGKAPA